MKSTSIGSIFYGIGILMVLISSTFFFRVVRHEISLVRSLKNADIIAAPIQERGPKGIKYGFQLSPDGPVYRRMQLGKEIWSPPPAAKGATFVNVRYSKDDPWRNEPSAEPVWKTERIVSTAFLGLIVVAPPIWVVVSLLPGLGAAREKCRGWVIGFGALALLVMTGIVYATWINASHTASLRDRLALAAVSGGLTLPFILWSFRRSRRQTLRVRRPNHFRFLFAAFGLAAFVLLSIAGPLLGDAEILRTVCRYYVGLVLLTITGLFIPYIVISRPSGAWVRTSSGVFADPNADLTPTLRAILIISTLQGGVMSGIAISGLVGHLTA